MGRGNKSLYVRHWTLGFRDVDDALKRHVMRPCGGRIVARGPGQVPPVHVLEHGAAQHCALEQPV